LICNYFGTNAWSDALNWPGQTAFQNAVNNTWTGPNGQPAGYWKSAQGFSHVIVYAAGHMVPFNQPENSHDMIYKFVNGFFN
jgi:cathepsin A (carboxypeptidase C)